MLISKRPQLVDNKVQRNRHQQVDDGRNGLADAEECNLNPEQHVGQNRRAAVADIGLAQPLELAAPVIGVASKDKLVIPEKALAMLRIVPRMLPTIYRSGLIHKKI